ncbi:MAG: helix-turn-helix transcriptional regulator [Propionibacteriaceae bacterium]|jgi:DNA-binding CsgD family transcriptional regulator|nr:helix-turn-helix transcriptional regulator [Propionibacteriaceae bacterium]
MQRPIVNEIVDYLTDGVSVNLVGLRRSGRTTVADAVIRELSDRGVNSIKITGVAPLADRPMAALAATGIEVPGGGASVGAVVAALSKRFHKETVLVIDDADDLDQVSSGVIAATRAQIPFPVLSISRQRGIRAVPNSDLVARFQPIVRLRMPTMEFNELHTMIHGLLPGVVGPSLVARIAVFTGGLPSLVEATIKNAVRTGILVRENGVWEAKSSLYSPRLAEMIEPLLQDVDEEGLLALTKISMLNTVAEADAERFVGRTNFASLIELGFVQTTLGTGDPLVGVFPPAVTEYLLHELTVPRQKQIIEELKQIDEFDSTRHVRRTCSKRLNVDESVFYSHRIREYWRVESLTLLAEWQADPVPERALPLVFALNTAGESAEKMLDIVAHTRKTKDIWAVRLLMWEATDRAVRCNDLQGAWDMMDAGAKSMPEFEHMFWFSKAHIQFLMERIPEIPDREIPEGADPLVGRVVDAVSTEVAIAQGRLQDALRLLDLPAPPSYLDFGSVERGLVYLFSGRVKEAVEYSEREFLEAREKLEPGLSQAHAFVLALGLCFQGRFRHAYTVISSALTFMGNSTMYKVFSEGLVSLASLAARWEGRREYSICLAGQTKDHENMGPYPAMLAQVTNLFVGGSTLRTDTDLWESVDDRLDRGYYLAGLFLAALVVEHQPNPDRAKRVYELSQGMQSDFMKTMGSYVWAVATKDVDLLCQTRTQMMASQSPMFALRAGVRLAVLLRAKDDFEGSMRVADETWQFGKSLPAIRSVLFETLVEAVDLSSREKDILSFISKDKVPSEIGLELNLSVRTVENHINNVYRKVGVGSRSQLQKALDSWLSGLK